MPLTARVIENLQHSSRYTEFLESTRWEIEPDALVREHKRLNMGNIMKGLRAIALAEEFQLPHFYGALFVKVFDNEGLLMHDFGLVSLRLVTTAGVNFLTDAFQGLQNLSTMRYHGIGLGTNAESVGDTGLQTELTTQLSTASTRATGTLTEGASANIYRTVGGNVVNTSVTVTEHGVFNQAAAGGGTLLDRSMFAGIGLVNGNTLQTTYELTTAAGG